MNGSWLSRHRKPVAVFVVVVLGLGLSLLATYIYNLPGDFWKSIGYPGIFLLSFIGTSSIVIPIPYTVVLLAISPAFDPILFTVAAGTGSAVGEMTGYLLGFLGRNALGEKRRSQMDAMLRIFRKFGSVAVFVFALTPLPDDLIFIPLGLMRYSPWKTLAACVAGKFTMVFIIGVVGKAVGELSGDLLITVLVSVLLILIILVIFKIDWVKLAEKYAPVED
ncbi:MAG: YqaA family protein [Candidatus Hadarchaeum sp.]|uniref:YqaA family protein n=1 Tax=Candidatus Hadarchaeum sp. TaxID=2883567 RepID=UPI003D0F6160